MISDRPAQIYAEDLKVGVVWAGKTRKMTDDHFRAFAEMTGDNHPIHYNDEYAANTRFGRRLAHGLLVTSMTALGATAIGPQLEDSMVAFVEQETKFLKPVFIGDELTPSYVVAAIDPKPMRGMSVVRFNLSLMNQSGEKVLEGHQSYLLLSAQASNQRAPSHAD